MSAERRSAGYFTTRLAYDGRRPVVWRAIAQYLRRWISADAAVLELGAGWCDLSNALGARRVVAVDADPTVATAAGPGVEAQVGDCRDLSMFSDGEFDVVAASNLLEHLERSDVVATLAEARRVLRPGGRLILIQPNFRLQPGKYFDDYTHISIFTDRALADLLTVEGFVIDTVVARFLPLTVHSPLAFMARLTPLYLRLPVRPLAGQMLVVATRPH